MIHVCIWFYYLWDICSYIWHMIYRLTGYRHGFIYISFGINHFFSFLPIIFIGCTLWNSMSENWSRKKTFRYVVLLYLLFCFDYGILNPNLCIPYRISYGFAIVIFMLAYYKRKSIEKISCKTLEYIADNHFQFI